MASMAGGGRNAPVMLALVCVVAVAGGQNGGGAAAASSASPVPSPDCSAAVAGLMDCLDFVQNGSRVAAPPGGCCSALKKVVKTEASCLCESFKSSADFGVALNMTRALSLPSSCGISIPFLGDCKIPGLGSPPAPSPQSVSPPSPAATVASPPSKFLLLACAAAAATRLYL